MNLQLVKDQLKSLSLSMFRKDFFGIYHGSISARLETTHFVINTNDAVFDNIKDEHLIDLYFSKDYRWKSASIDAEIHHGIYKTSSDAKFITFSMPPFTTAYSLNHNVIIPKDYFGDQYVGELNIYDPKKFDDWYDRAATEIPHYFQQNKTNILIIKGYGVYTYNRDMHEMTKQLAILEKSCRLLMLTDSRASKLDLDY